MNCQPWVDKQQNSLLYLSYLVKNVKFIKIELLKASEKTLARQKITFNNKTENKFLLICIDPAEFILHFILYLKNMH